MLNLLIGARFANDDGAEIFFDTWSSEQELAVEFAVSRVAFDAVTDETFGEFGIRFVHSQKAFFRRHQELSGVVEVLALLLLACGKFAEFFGG